MLGIGQIKAGRQLHQSLLVNILRSPGQFFDTTPVGRILNRFAKDIDGLDADIPRNIRGFMMCAFEVIGTCFVVGISTPFVLTVILPLGILYYFVQVATCMLPNVLELCICFQFLRTLCFFLLT